MSAFDKYLGSYERVSPYRGERLRRIKRWTEHPEEYEEYRQNNPLPENATEYKYEEVTPENYPDLYDAVTEECEFRGIERPGCYVSDNPDVKLGRANPSLYEIYIEPVACKIFNKKELRALVAHEIKHLYQGKPLNYQRTMKSELDCDRAAVESTDLETLKSYVDKVAHYAIDRKVPKILRRFVHGLYDTYPDFILENAIYPLDRYHPSPADRWLNIKEHAAKIDRERQATQKQDKQQNK